MDIKTIKKNDVTYHLLKSNRYKKTSIELSFCNEVKKDKLSSYALMLSMLDESSKDYPTERLNHIAKEELYNTRIGISVNKTGNLYRLSLKENFINFEYIDEKDYLDKVITYFSKILYHPYFDNEKTFKKLQKDLILAIESSKEFLSGTAFENSLKLMDEESITCLHELGKPSIVEKITYKDLENIYNELLNDSKIDVFIMGNTDLDKVLETFLNHFDLKGNNKDIDIYINNKERDEVIYKEESSKFNQTSLNMIYNINGLTFDETEFVFPVLNYILSSGGLTSKLYRYVREENSLCYGIYLQRLKQDNIIIITSELKYENVEKAISLIDKALKEMQDGIFTEDDIKEAKDNIKTSINLRKKDPYALYSQYLEKYIYKSCSLEDKEKGIEKVTKDEIVKVASKIKKNCIYVLCEDKNGKN